MIQCNIWPSKVHQNTRVNNIWKELFDAISWIGAQNVLQLYQSRFLRSRTGIKAETFILTANHHTKNWNKQKKVQPKLISHVFTNQKHGSYQEIQPFWSVMLHRETSEARMILNHRRQFNVTKKIKNKMLKIETLMWRTFLEAQSLKG